MARTERGTKGREKKRREYPQKQHRKSLPQSSSQHESGYQRHQWWLRAERYDLRKRLLHEGLSSRLDGGWKGKGSDKGGDGTEGRRKREGKGKGNACTTRVATNPSNMSHFLTRRLVLTPSNTPSPCHSPCDDARSNCPRWCVALHYSTSDKITSPRWAVPCPY